MAQIRRKGVVYVRTTIELPETQRNRARELGIGLSSTLTEALERKIEEKIELSDLL
jgi:hypothetical protein